MFKEAADIKTSDQLHLPVPDAKFETVVVKPSEIQQDMVQALSERAAEVHSGSVDPSVDNMLKITSDGRKIGLDQRLMNSALPDDPNSKLNACVNNVLRIWNDTKEQKLTQLIFCDMSTPKGDGSFNVYDDIRTKLLNATRGEATMFHHFSEYGAYRGDFNGRKNGSMISMSTEKSVAYALDTLQERGKLFVGPGEDCYEGMIVGESAKEGDMVVNIAKSKQLGNQRSSGADKAIQLTPPQTFTLEEALEYIEDDELVEVTPQSIRLRKRILNSIERKKANKN